jgi:TRAP-type C4-dicarboxylate transport system substrate-binding protein
MKRLLLILIACAIILMSMGTIISCSSEPEETVVLRMAVPWPIGDPVTNNIQEFIDKFNDQADGKYVIELHPSESLVALMESMDALRNGTVEMAGWPIGIYGNLDPVFSCAELPFVVNSVEGDAALTVEMMPLYDEVMTEKFNMKPVFAFTCLGIDMMSKEPVHTLADWKGLLTQTISPQTAKVVELLGGAGVAMPFAEGYQGLQKKTIEASLQSGSMMIMFKMNEVADYVLSAYLTPASIVIAVNLDVYNDMPKDIQELVVKLGKEAQASTNEFFIDVYFKNYDTMDDLGITVYRLPKAERDVWAEKLDPYAEELFAEMDPDMAKKIRTIAEDLDKKYPYTE